MTSPEKELEEKLIETGNKLLNPPSDADELLNLLDLVETYLSRVEQSPSKSTLNALGASMKALVGPEFLRHSDTDVKVAVASCISEITRITAPDAPYDDEQMKDIFQMIVAAFENLSDLSSRSYLKRVSILETVAKVRSCVVMLDLECDSLILEMFRHFFKAIRDEHPDNVFSSMETIMSMVLEESEDISLELLSSLLQSVKKEDNDLLSIARKLGEKVIVSCSSKLKPYLMQAVQSNDLSLDEYNKVIADIYQGSGDLAEMNQKAQSPKNEEAEKVEHNDVISELEHTPKSPKPMVNGTAENNDTLVDQKSSKKTTDATTKSELVDLETKPTKPDSFTGKSSRKTKSSKSSSLKQSKDMHEPSHREVSNDKRVSTGEAGNMISEASFIKETSSREPDKDSLLSLEPQGKHINQDSTRSKRGKQQSKRKNGNSVVDMPRSPTEAGQKSNKKIEASGEAPLTPPAEAERTASGEKVEPNVPLSSNINSKSESEGTSGPEKRLTGDNDDDVSSLKKKSDGISGSRTKISAKKVHKRNVDESILGKEKENKKQLKESHSANKKAEFGDINKKKIASPLKLSTKSSSKVGTSDENSIAKSKRKRVVGEVSEISYGESKLDESLVGAKIKVWWPDDKQFYEGAIASYDPDTKKHKILYTDGDEEILQLKNERWKLIGGSGRGKADVEKVIDSSERSQKKKTKSSLESSDKKSHEEQVKMSGKSTTTSKFTETTPKSNMKTKSDSKQKSNTRTKADTPRTATKSSTKDITSKSSTKSKVDEEASKMGSKSKDALSKDVIKSKHDTPKTNNKSKTSPKSVGKSDTKSETPKSGTFKPPRMDRESKEQLLKSSNKVKSVTPKVLKESVSSRGKSTTSKANISEGSPKRKQSATKSNENDSKSVKKRRRNVNT